MLMFQMKPVIIGEYINEIVDIKYWRDKVADVSDQQLWLSSSISGPSTAPSNFSTNVFLAWKSKNVRGEILSAVEKNTDWFIMKS